MSPITFTSFEVEKLKYMQASAMKQMHSLYNAQNGSMNCSTMIYF